MDGETIFQLSNRIREYESAAAVVDALARFSTDKEVTATLRRQAEELRGIAAKWLDRQNREFAPRDVSTGKLCKVCGHATPYDNGLCGPCYNSGKGVPSEPDLPK